MLAYMSVPHISDCGTFHPPRMREAARAYPETLRQSCQVASARARTSILDRRFHIPHPRAMNLRNVKRAPRDRKSYQRSGILAISLG